MPTDLSIPWMPILPGWLIALLAIVLLALLAHGSVALLRKDVPRRWVAILGGWRLCILVVFVLALLQPIVSYTSGGDSLSDLIVLLDMSRSMAQPGGDGSRLDEVRALLRDGEMAAALRRRCRLHFFAFDRSAYPVAVGDLDRLGAAGATTRYADSIAAAANQFRAQGGVPRRVLLVSDGNDLGKADPVEKARALGLTIDTLAPGVPETPPSTGPAVVEVQCARRVLLGSETHFRVTLRSGAPRNQAVTVPLRVLEDGKEVRELSISFRAGQPEQRLSVGHRPTTAGLKRYEFRLGAGGDKEAPAYALSVRVIDGKDEVLILEDTWRWEFKYLRRVLEEDPSFRYTAILSRGGTGSFLQFASPDRRVNLVGFPQGRAGLEGFDILVLGDVNPKHWPRTLAPAIAEMVREDGKSLVVLAGPNLAHLAEVPELNVLLPVEVARETATPLGGPVDIRPSLDGRQSAFLSARVIETGLPPVDQIYPPRHKRPGATVLLEASRLKNTNGNLIVMAEHTVGRGRVLYLGTDTLWKWHTLANDDSAGTTPHGLFWQQALRAMTPARPSLPGVNLWIDPDRTHGVVGETIRIRAEIETDRPLPLPRIEATLLVPDDRPSPLVFTQDPTEPAVFRAEFEPPTAGPYRLRATLNSEGKNAAEGSAVLEIDEPREETADAGVDRANLARIATATGGQMLDPARPETWPQDDIGSTRSASQARTLDLWNGGTLLYLLCAMLGIDWLVRLRRGYV